MNELLRLLARQLDRHPLPRAHRVDDAAHQIAQLALVGQLEGETNGHGVDVFRQLERIPGEHDGRSRGGESLRQVTEGTGHVRIRQVRRHVLEQVDGVVDGDALDVAQRGERIACLADRRAGEAMKATGQRPLVHRQPEVDRHFMEQRSDAVLLHRFNGDQGMEGENESLEVVDRGPMRHRSTSLDDVGRAFVRRINRACAGVGRATDRAVGAARG